MAVTEKRLWLCFMNNCCCQLIILFHLIRIQAVKLTFANWFRTPVLLLATEYTSWNQQKDDVRGLKLSMETNYYLIMTSNLLFTLGLKG